MLKAFWGWAPNLERIWVAQLKQLKFISNELKNCTREFGGELLKGSRKSSRPLSSKRSLHLVLRADTAQTGSIRKFKNGISALLDKYSKKFGVKIYKYAIAGNHIHIVLLAPHRVQYRAWIRTFTARLSVSFKIKWAHRPWSRVLSWGREFKTVVKYVLQNILEAEGVIAYKPRKYKTKRKLTNLQI